MTHPINPPKQGLYDPRYEHDSCGVGFVVDLQKPQIARHRRARRCRSCCNLEHRGACGCEKNTGDGAGILVQMPHALPGQGVRPARHPPAAAGRLRRRHGLPADRRRRPPALRASCSSRSCARKGRPSSAGATCRSTTRRSARRRARRSRSSGRSSSAAAPLPRSSPTTLGLRAQALRHPPPRRERGRATRTSRQRGMFYVPSLSCKTLIYKGMLNAGQVEPFFPDLHDPDLESALALVHSRFSTNTFPTWARAHPYRYLAHNGEINTLRGNVNWMHARESLFASELFGDDIKKLLPIIDQTGSDSAMFDNALELLVLSGRSLPHAVMMMIPEPWSGDETMSAGKEGVLRVSLLPDGAVGRPGVDRLHRRHAHRRRARPQRPAAVALLRHQGRPGHHGVRGRRARHRRRSGCCTRAACSRAACSSSIWSRAASSPTRS